MNHHALDTILSPAHSSSNRRFDGTLHVLLLGWLLAFTKKHHTHHGFPSSDLVQIVNLV